MIIAQGAEAVISQDKDRITKERIRKSYRIEDIDKRLRISRTRREANILKKLELLDLPAPRLIEKDDTRIVMSRIRGKKLRDVLAKEHFPEIARKIAILHNNDIIHGDLTTSNMVLDDEIYLIDFGLSFYSTKPEDKAVDLHLLKQALNSKHYDIADFGTIIEEYCRHGDPKVVKRLETVEKRGRNKMKA